MTLSKGPVWVGWREMAALPDWGIPRILAKIDTGARTSALHVEDLEEQPDGLLHFQVVVRERPERRLVEVTTKPVRWSRVRPSSGEAQVRPVVRTRLHFDNWSREVEISLVQRRGMLCRMLVGRTSMHGLVVDPTHRYLASEGPTSKHPSPKRPNPKRPNPKRPTSKHPSPKPSTSRTATSPKVTAEKTKRRSP